MSESVENPKNQNSLQNKIKKTPKKRKNWYKEITNEILSNKYTAVLLLIIMGFSNLNNVIDTYDKLVYWVKPKGMSDEALKIESFELSRDIFEFGKERKLNEPEIDFDNWGESTELFIYYSYETMQLYNTRFGKRLAIVREEYMKRGIIDNDFETFYKYPTNYFGIVEVASRLSAMTTYLK